MHCAKFAEWLQVLASQVGICEAYSDRPCTAHLGTELLNCLAKLQLFLIQLVAVFTAASECNKCDDRN